MKGFRNRTDSSKYPNKSSSDSSNKFPGSICSEPGAYDSKHSKTSVWSGFLVSVFSIFETHSESKDCGKKESSTRGHGWTAAVKRVMIGASMRRIQERILGLNKTGISISSSDIWLLGVCYKISQEYSSADPAHSNGFAAFVEDFESRILMTYRKGFTAIGDSKYTSDVNWGCMLRSSQMLRHWFSISWADIGETSAQGVSVTVEWPNLYAQIATFITMQPLNQEYVEILHYFGDSEASAFSIHNLLQAGNAVLSPGLWVGPYAMCRTWETLARSTLEENAIEYQSLPMAVYVVSGDEDGEQGGAPVVCVEDVSRHCFEFSRGQVEWSPILLLVPLVLGLDKINPRYIPLLAATFSFSHSLGILGGRPGASTYIVGVQDDKAFYLDPHEVQQAIDIRRDNLEADTSSYHCNVIRQIPLDSIDPSLAIGFYCRDKDDFYNFCFQASELADQSNGAPLFTVTQTGNLLKATAHHETSCDSSGVHEGDPFDLVPAGDAENNTREDDWQIL